MAAAHGILGASIKRREDSRLLRGAGRYVDDLHLPGTLHAAFVRSPHAHARIRTIDLAPALALPGVVVAVAGREVAERLGALPTEGWKLPGPALRAAIAPLYVATETQPLLAVERTRYVGEPVAVVVAESRYLAEDAAERVVVDYEPLPPITSVDAARAPDAPRIHPELPDNLSTHIRIGTGDVEAAFAQADHVVRLRLHMQRLTGIPIEPRGTLARREPGGRLMVWSATQTPHALRNMLAHLLQLDPARIRVVAPDVGGGFGIKGLIYPEELLVSWLAYERGVPVKWIEDRYEHFRAAIHSRDQEHEIALALRADGTILGLRDRFTIDMGAYNPLGLVQPYNTSAHLCGPYRVPAVDIESHTYFTNKAPLAPYRGAGRPEAVFVMDRILDRAARALGLDPAELRRRNLVTAAEMPYATGLLYRDGQPLVYDSGDYPACLAEALRLIDYEGVRAAQPGWWAQGRYRGVGLSAYVEGTGVGPFEGGAVRIDATGHVWVFTGACSQGQGHETTFAQLAAAELHVPLEQVTVVPGDTAGIARGWGTLASRSAVVGGTAIAQASQDLAAQLKQLAAELLEAAPADLELHRGTVRVIGTPSRSVTFAQLVAHARATRGPEAAPADASAPLAPAAHPAVVANGGAHAPEHLATSLEATRYFEPPTVTYANAVHAALVEVDIATGAVQLLKYVVVHDCGRVINPLVVDGQVAGGVAQGIGNALLEELVYDPNGQLTTASLMDYLLPTSEQMPPLALGHHESPSPRNPLGIKGLGEGGCISPPAAISNAVEDALRPLGVVVDRTPLTPERVLALIEAARARDTQG
jgi:carbon-monoxide dehydrogenase large subunit